MLGKNNKTNSLRFIAVLMVFAAGILAILGTNGNGNGGGGGAIARPQILTFDYDLQNLGNATGVAAELTSGARSIGQFMPAAPCVFIADFSVATTPEFNLNGQPGQTGTNVSIVSTNPTNASSSNPASCPALEEIKIYIGSTSAALNLGIAQSQAYAEITIGGEIYSTLASGYFSASLDTFDSSDGYLTGKFEFLAQIPGASTVVVKGDYAGN